ncbi:lipopolysaccharide biosynthesis protein [Ramlibacter monticola]|uniref:Lipopolysaccharide biosynthesis protein n=1 Tax=Ramlibacter monticola TaxID=1926872 RepID=A0A937CVT8_9BURK|nr:lipopolysaccharide biosynthesis protein [Ramlibacter monticola]MBL0394128.1 lipopolysaccharide biosynthesis protein [Ramlibacter monticola]
MTVAAARAVVNVLATLSTILLARFLTPEDFGLVAIAISVLAISNSLTELSLVKALIRVPVISDDHLATAFTLEAIRSTLLGGLLASLASPLASLYGDRRLVAIMLVIALTTFIGGLLNPKIVLFTRDIDFRAEIARSLTERLVGIVVGIAIAALYLSYWALVLGPLMGRIATVVYSYMQVHYRPRLSISRAKEMLSFSVWLSLSQMVITAAVRLDELVIGYVLGKSVLGSYSVGERFSLIAVREVSEPVATTLLPSFSKISGDRLRLASAYGRAQSALFAIALPLGVGFAAVSDLFVAVVLGPQWAGAALVIKIAAPVMALQTLSSQVQPLALALGAPRSIFIREVQYLLVRVPVVYFGLFAYGIPGLLLGRAVAGVLGTVLNLSLARKLAGPGIRAQVWASRRTFAATAIMVAAILTYERLLGHVLADNPVLNLAGTVLVGAIAHCAALAGLWVAERRPAGPESELAQAVRHLTGKVRLP